MMRKSRIIDIAVQIAILMPMASCSKSGYACTDNGCGEITVIAECGRSKAYDAYTENGIWDLNLFVTGEEGLPEYHSYVTFGNSRVETATEKFRLLYGRRYSLYAMANAGFDMGTLDGGELDSYRFHLIYPDHFERGFPMAAKKILTAEKGAVEELRLERLVSKVTVRLDRSTLDRDVDFNIAGARVGNSPRWIRPFGDSAVEDAGKDLFPSGYHTEGGDILDVYLAENIQDKFDPALCSFLELDIDYSSSIYYTDGDSCLKYRFYIREDDGCRVERNSHYRVVVKPEKDGLLCEDSWRVDKSALLRWSGDPYLKISPGGSTIDGVYYENYYELKRGSSRHFSLASFPADMKIWLDNELVEDELEDGRVEYRMDDDGRGFTVTSLGRACVSMMEIHAGSPFDDYIMICVCVE